MKSVGRAVVLAALLIARTAIAQTFPVVPPPAPEVVPVTAEEAVAIAAKILSTRVGPPRESARRFDFDATGLAGDRACPLEGVREVKCGDFAFSPSAVTVYRHSWVAAVSGHLARNRVVMVDLFSETAPIANGTVHGVLVFPGPAVTASPKPAFAWYASRLAFGVGLDLADVDADGALDLVYTYQQYVGLGVRIVVRDVWTVTDMRPQPLVSSGEKLSGVLVSTFAGVPLAVDGDGWMRRGEWTLAPLGPGRPQALVFERGGWPGGRTGWDLHVVADLGDGWREYLAGAGGDRWNRVRPPQDDDAAAGADCSPADTGDSLTVAARRRLLDLEEDCRAALSVLPPGATPDPLAAPGRLWVAMRLHAGGLHLAAAALEEAASADLEPVWPLAWPVSALLSLHAAIRAHMALVDAYDPRFSDPPEGWLDALAPFPALRPITFVLGW